MKQLLSIILSLVVSSYLSAQSFKTGKMIFDYGTGFSMHKTIFTNKTFPSIPILKGATEAVVFHFTYEYAILDWLGAGLRLDFSRYLQNDIEKKNGKRVFGLSSLPSINAHFLRTRHIDVFASGEVGYSRIFYTSNEPNNAIAKANGIGYNIGLKSRCYFGSPESGIHLHVSYWGNGYRNGVVTDDMRTTTLYKFSQKGTAIVFEIGFQYKI